MKVLEGGVLGGVDNSLYADIFPAAFLRMKIGRPIRRRPMGVHGAVPESGGPA